MDDETATAAADRLLHKLREFAQSLDDHERALLAALLAPGVTRALEEDDVEAYGLVEWLPERLPAALAEAIRGRNVRIEGL